MSHHTTTPSNMKTDWETLSIFAHLKNCYYSTVRKWIRQNEHRKWREFSVSLFSLRLYPSFPLPPLSFLPTSSPLSLSLSVTTLLLRPSVFLHLFLSPPFYLFTPMLPCLYIYFALFRVSPLLLCDYFLNFLLFLCRLCIGFYGSAAE